MLQEQVSVSADVEGVRTAVGQAVASVVPDEHIDASVQEESQVECMWMVYHMLVEHGIGVAKQESRHAFILRRLLIHRFTCGSEEHAVQT